MTTRTDVLKIRMETDGQGNVKASLAGVATESQNVEKGMKDVAAAATTQTAALDKARAAQDRLTAASIGQTKAFSGTSKTAREMQFAMRGLPAQFTDIATAIGSGQRPLSILLQQGGQIKDMFGGVGPALKAMGGYIMGLVNPYTVAAAAAGVLFLAWKGGSDELVAYNKALALTGDYAGVTAAQLQGMAHQLDNVSGVTEHTAASVVALVTKSGRFYGDQIEMVSRAALEMQQATGQALDQTIAEFEKLGRDPVQGLLDLNQSMHFLTQATYDQVTALIQRGEKDKAAQIAQQAYANAVKQRADGVRENLGLLEKAWHGITGAAGEAWDAMLNVGRAESVDEKIKAVQAKLAAAQDQLRTGQRGTIGLSASQINAGLQAQQVDRGAVQQQVDALKAQLKSLQFEKLTGGDIFGRANSAYERQVAQRIAAQQALASGAGGTAQTTLNARLNELAVQKAQALMGVVDPQQRQIIIEEFNRQVAEAAQQYDQAEKKLAPHAAKVGPLAGGAKAGTQGKGSAAADDKDKLIAAQFTKTLQDQVAARKRALDIQIASVGMGQKEAAQLQQLNDLEQQRINQVQQLQRQQIAHPEQYAALQRQIDAVNASYKDMRDTMLDGFRRLDAAQANWANGLTSAMQDWIDQGKDVAGMTAQTFNDAFGSMNNALVNFVVTGKASFGDLVKSVLADLARMELRVIESQVLQSLLGAFLGGSSGTSIASSYMAGGGASYASSGVNWDVGVLGRAGGGPVAGGALYEVAEGGKPEVLNSAGHTYLLMGPQGGYVEPAQRGDTHPAITGRGGGGDTINLSVITNVDSNGVQSQQSSGTSRSEAAKQLSDQMKAAATEVLMRAMQPGGVLWKQHVGQIA